MKKIKILLIEDKVKLIKNSIEKYLKKVYKVKIAVFNNGEEALKYIKGNSPPNLILLDLKIPFSEGDVPQRENGEKVLKKLCQMETPCIIPTIIITAYPDLYEEPSSFGRKYKIYGYLDKSDGKFYEKLIRHVQEIIDGEIKYRNQFCSIAKKTCFRNVNFKGRNSCFLAYPSQARYVGFMKDLKKELQRNQIDALDWLDKDREFDNPSGLIFCPFLCDRIFSRNIFIANISDKNLNVFFEWGFALGIGRKSYALCENAKIKQLPPLFKANLCTPYTYNSSSKNIIREFHFDDYLKNLYGKVTDIFPSLSYSPGAINALGIFPNNRNHIISNISRFIGTLCELYIEQENDIIQVLSKVCSTEKVLFYLLPNGKKTLDINIQMSFLIGFALGQKKRILVLQQGEIDDKFLDMYNKIIPCNNVSKVEKELKGWIK